jgi:hypothetical protein
MIKNEKIFFDKSRRQDPDLKLSMRDLLKSGIKRSILWNELMKDKKIKMTGLEAKDWPGFFEYGVNLTCSFLFSLF